ncbi:hypothetical protein [Zavarzinella formosa]|uniref:hypothetical protein n=1 Tax=Zavarzinella formosa TaxID=360055 RepID=UPI00030289FD|nr:hypothetical protein [Zavarzinella formosa]
MSQQALSPLVQVMQQPSLVISILHVPIIMLWQHTIMPFMEHIMEHMPPAIMEQRFCIIVQEAMSSHMQVIFIPPVIFSIFIVQRGTMTMFGIMEGIEPIDIPVPMEGMVIAARSIIIAVDMFDYLMGDVSSKINVSTRLDGSSRTQCKKTSKIPDLPDRFSCFSASSG